MKFSQNYKLFFLFCLFNCKSIAVIKKEIIAEGIALVSVIINKNSHNNKKEGFYKIINKSQEDLEKKEEKFDEVINKPEEEKNLIKQEIPNKVEKEIPKSLGRISNSSNEKIADQIIKNILIKVPNELQEEISKALGRIIKQQTLIDILKLTNSNNYIIKIIYNLNKSNLSENLYQLTISSSKKNAYNYHLVKIIKIINKKKGPESSKWILDTIVDTNRGTRFCKIACNMQLYQRLEIINKKTQ